MPSLLQRLLGHSARESAPDSAPAWRTETLIRNPHCDVPEVDKWALSDLVTQVIVPQIGVRPFPVDELLLMVTAVALTRPTHIFEWGTHVGRSARVFRECTVALELDCVIHSVDLPDDTAHVEHPGAGRGHFVKGLPGVFLHQGDGVRVSLELARAAPDGARMLFFVDGDHEYHSVFREVGAIANAAPRAAVLLHDTFWQSPESGYNVGPYQAIADTLATLPGRFHHIETRNGLPGMTLLLPRGV